MFEIVLLAVDGSPESDRAARMAVELANVLGSELHVVHVVDVSSVYAYSGAIILDPEFKERMRKRGKSEARERLDEQVGKVKEAGGRVAGVHAVAGRPDAEIVRLAEELGAGLVVLGSRGFGPLKRAVMGSVSGSVARHAHCPVLVVRGDGRGEENYLPGRILLALDGSEDAAAAANAAAEISGAIGSELHVVHALPTEPRPPYPHPFAGEGWEAGLERAKHDARAFVDRRAERMEAEGAEVKDAHLALGEPDHEIVKLGEELDAAIIVIGSRGLGGMRRALMGSVSDSVVRHAHCPVLVIRGEGSG